MKRRILKVYADTSVYGGVFDEEFEEASKLFFKQVDMGIFELIISPIVIDEIDPAPKHVRDLFYGYANESTILDVHEEIIQLHNQYISKGIVGKNCKADALHVAFATVSECNIIVSWNFKEIVHFQKIPMYNAVNKINGYNNIAIHTPEEVIYYEEE